MKFDTQLKVDNFIQDDLLEISDSFDITDLMQKSTKVSKMNRKRPFLQKYIPLVASRLMALSSAEWKFNDIAFVFYGLRYMKITDECVEDILKVMTGITARAVINGKQAFGSRDIATLLFGLQNMSSEKKTVRELLT
jgi:precorrin-6B methylase 1